MEENFWHQRWESNKIGFHKSHVNPMLEKHFSKLALQHGDRLFLPLCGKTLDIAWLLDNGYRVAGAELSELAIEQLFDELNLTPQITISGRLKRYTAEHITVYVGNIFDLQAAELGEVQAIYDRAALVALPADMRIKYTSHLTGITNNAPQLLVCLEYDQSLMEGPPFSIHSAEVQQHYSANYKIELIEKIEQAKGLKGQHDATERAWLLTTA